MRHLRVGCSQRLPRDANRAALDALTTAIADGARVVTLTLGGAEVALTNLPWDGCPVVLEPGWPAPDAMEHDDWPDGHYRKDESSMRYLWRTARWR